MNGWAGVAFVAREGNTCKTKFITRGKKCQHTKKQQKNGTWGIKFRILYRIDCIRLFTCGNVKQNNEQKKNKIKNNDNIYAYTLFVVKNCMNIHKLVSKKTIYREGKKFIRFGEVYRVRVEEMNKPDDANGHLADCCRTMLSLTSHLRL